MIDLSEGGLFRRRRTAILFLVLTFFLIAGVQPVSAKAGIRKFTVKITAGTKKYKKSMLPGDQLQLVVKQGNKKLAVKKVNFSSSKSKVAAVSKKGTITAKKAGKAVITVKYKKKKAKITVTVKAVPSVGVETDTTRTIKNYLLGSLEPVGRVLYVWGGGWNDSTTKGITSTMKIWYRNQSKDYNFQKYSDLSPANRAKGFDQAGYVGWCAYQVMHEKSNEGSGYTVKPGVVGSTYKTRGWGTTINQNDLFSKSYTLKAGDIGYNNSHCFIIIGQCKDKSAVILHSYPQAGVQIAGTATPDGNYNSEAVALAAKYMSRYPGSGELEYDTSVGNYIKGYNFFRWNRSTLADPDGYMHKTANQILADLFASSG